jgi:aspartyl-tRNA(Asn)/glutamyl-tRNA(Gln) amidotransferase subunit C
MKSRTKITLEEVKHLAKLANLHLSDSKLQELLPQFASILEFVSKVQSLNTENIHETSQVTGLENVFREDVVDDSRMLSQKEALSNAKKTYNGFFSVDAIFE